MRLAPVALAALATLSACGPYAGTYGYSYQTAPAVSDYGYSDYGYSGGYAEPSYASPYYAPPVAGAVIIGNDGYRDRWRGDRWREDRRWDNRPREEGWRGDRFGGGRPDDHARPVFAQPSAPAAPFREAPRPIAPVAAPAPPPPSGGRAFEDWNRTHVNAGANLGDANGAR